MADVQTLGDDPASYDMTMDDLEDILCFSDNIGLTSVLAPETSADGQQLQQNIMSSLQDAATDILARQKPTPEATHSAISESRSPDTSMEDLRSISLDSSLPSQENAEDSYVDSSASLCHSSI